MKIGTTTKVTIGVAGILVAGFISLQLGTRLIGTNSSETDISTPETSTSQSPFSETGTSQKPVQSAKSQPGASGQKVEDEKNIQEFLAWLDSLDADTAKKQSSSTKSDQKTLPGTSQSPSETVYHKTYDTFIGITKEMALVKAEMAPMNEELERLVGEWKRSVRDPKNLTEEEERLTIEMKEASSPLWEELQESKKHLVSLIDSLIDEIKTAVPGAIQTESRDYGPKGTVSVVRVDYERVRSALGSLPEETDAYLTEFFADFERTSYEGIGK